MVRIYAQVHAAQVVELQGGRYWADEGDVDEAVCPPEGVVHAASGIAVVVGTALPDPASDTVDSDSGVDPCCDVKQLSGLPPMLGRCMVKTGVRVSGAGSLPPLVVNAAQSSLDRSASFTSVDEARVCGLHGVVLLPVVCLCARR